MGRVSAGEFVVGGDHGGAALEGVLDLLRQIDLLRRITSYAIEGLLTWIVCWETLEEFALIHEAFHGSSAVAGEVMTAASQTRVISNGRN